MERQKPVAERIRPILEAMERSIDSARSRRGIAPSANTHAAPKPSERPVSTTPIDAQDRPSSGDEAAPRLKARPKRPSQFDPSGWRSAS